MGYVMNRRFLGVKIGEGLISLHPEEIHHAVRVLRINPGDRIYVFDLNGNEWLGEVLAIDKKNVVAKILEEVSRDTEPEIRIAAAVSPPKGQRWDFLLEKLTEIGISEIVPLITSRTVRVIHDRRERWRRIVLSAVKQSQRTKLPVIHPPLKFNEILERFAGYEKKFIATPQANYHREVLQKVGRFSTVCYLIGPEGGFSEVEIKSALKAGFEPINLGPRILRVETAAIVLGILLLEYSSVFSD